MSGDISFKLKDDWEVKSVAELVKERIIEKPLDGNHGSIHPKASDYIDSGVPFIMASDLDGGRVNYSTCKFISYEQANKLRKGFSKEGDVLISHKATIGRTAIVQRSEYNNIILTPQVTYYRVIDFKKLSNIYLKAYFDSKFFQNTLNLWAGAGSTRAYLGITEQLKLPVILPPIKKQIEIASYVGNLDDKIHLNNQINKTLEEMAQAIFKSWFVDFAPVKAKMAALVSGGSVRDAELAAMSDISGKDEDALVQFEQDDPQAYKELAETAALFPSAMQESELGEIPEGWGISEIGESYKVIMGQSPKGNTYNEQKEGVMFFQGRAEFGWRFPTPRLYTTDPKRMAKKDDILLSVRAPVGDLNWALNDCCIGRGLSALRHHSGCSSYSYVHLNYLKDVFNRFNSEGTVFGSINQKDLKAIKIVEPEKKLVKLLTSKVTDIDNLIANLNEQIIALSSIRDTLLPKLLSGEIDLSAIETEVDEACS